MSNCKHKHTELSKSLKTLEDGTLVEVIDECCKKCFKVIDTYEI